jgi:alpha-galactosidase
MLAAHGGSSAAHQSSGERRSRRKSIPVEAALGGDPRLVFQAICYDPLTAAMLSLAETIAMVNEMLEQNRDKLPEFEHLKV